MQAGRVVFSGPGTSAQKTLVLQTQCSAELPLGVAALAMIASGKLQIALVMPPGVSARTLQGDTPARAGVLLIRAQQDYEVHRGRDGRDGVTEESSRYTLRFEPGTLTITAEARGQRTCSICYEALPPDSTLAVCAACGTGHCALCARSADCLDCQRALAPPVPEPTT